MNESDLEEAIADFSKFSLSTLHIRDIPIVDGAQRDREFSYSEFADHRLNHASPHSRVVSDSIDEPTSPTPIYSRQNRLTVSREPSRSISDSLLEDSAAVKELDTIISGRTPSSDRGRKTSQASGILKKQSNNATLHHSPSKTSVVTFGISECTEADSRERLDTSSMAVETLLEAESENPEERKERRSINFYSECERRRKSYKDGDENLHVFHSANLPQEMFIEMDELYSPCSLDGFMEWRQTGRWVLYEEMLEEGSNRLGKPHIPSLSFHSMLELRHCLKAGIVLLDVHVKNMRDLLTQTLQALLSKGHIRDQDREWVLHMLMVHHRHISSKKLQSQKAYPSLCPCWESNKKSNVHGDIEFLKRLDPASEAASILVGADYSLTRPVIAFLRLDPALPFSHLLEVFLPLRFLFIVIGPNYAMLDYQEIGRCMGTLLSNERFRAAAYQAEDKAALLQAFNQVMDDSIILPPMDLETDSLVPYAQIRKTYSKVRKRKLSIQPTTGFDETEELIAEKVREFHNNPLRRTKTLFGGLKREFRQRLKLYISDFTDALNFKCLTSVTFIFLTCFCPTMAFGTIYDEDFQGWIGIKETLLATSVAGIIFSLVSAQPMMLIGASGPMLVFEKTVSSFCSLNDWHYLKVRFWLSIWALMFCVIAVALEGSFLIQFVTTFSDDILTGLISVIFITKSLGYLQRIFSQNPLMAFNDYCVACDSNVTNTLITWINKNQTLISTNVVHTHDIYKNQPNTSLLACVQVFGTCILAFMLYQFRISRYFGRKIRNLLGDIGPPIAIIIMALIDMFIFRDQAMTEKLNIEPGLRPTLASQRDWVVTPWPVPIWMPPVSAVTGFLLFMVLFCETEVCEMILARKELCLKKGTGYHWDLLLSGMLLVFCSVLGLPWLTAIPVRSMIHVHSLTHYKLRAPGQPPRVTGVVEQRVTGLMLNVLMGLTLFATNILRVIPIGVLFGIFLYLGLISIIGLPMLSRFMLLFVPVKYHPTTSYCLRVETWRMHVYTVFQFFCFIFVFSVKSITLIAMTFPFAILLTLLMRHWILPKIFTFSELEALDKEEEEEEKNEQTEKNDFYTETRRYRHQSVAASAQPNIALLTKVSQK